MQDGSEIEKPAFIGSLGDEAAVEEALKVVPKYQEDKFDVAPSLKKQVAKSDITSEQIIQAEEQRLQREKEDPFGEALKRIDISGKTEEELVPELNYLLGDYGFKFEEAGFGDQIKIKAPSGEEKTIGFGELTSAIDPSGS